MKMGKAESGIPGTENLFSFGFLRDAFWSRRRLILATTVLGLAAGIAATVLTGGKYMISMTLIPAESDIERGSALQLSNILSNNSDQPVSKFKQFQAELFSYRTAELMDRNYGTLCEISKTRCDVGTRTWTPKPEWRRALSLTVSTLLGMPPAPEKPEINDLVKYLRDTVTITTEKASSVTVLSIQAKDPENGKLFLKRLVNEANQTVRERDRADLRQYVDYVTQRLENLTAVAQRAALDSLLLTEERRLMLTNVQVAYAATILDGPNATRSNSVWKTGVGLAVGLLLGCCIALIQEFLSGNAILLKPSGKGARLRQRAVAHDARP